MFVKLLSGEIYECSRKLEDGSCVIYDDDQPRDLVTGRRAVQYIDYTVIDRFAETREELEPEGMKDLESIIETFYNKESEDIQAVKRVLKSYDELKTKIRHLKKHLELCIETHKKLGISTEDYECVLQELN